MTMPSGVADMGSLEIDVERLRAPSFFAIVTAAAMPRDLNERVGFFDSSLT